MQTTLEIPPHTKVLATVDVVERTVITPVTENAIVDFAIDIDLYNWAENNAPYLDGGEDTADNRLHFDNVQDFLDFYDGLHPREHPGMDNYRRDMRA